MDEKQESMEELKDNSQEEQQTEPQAELQPQPPKSDEAQKYEELARKLAEAEKQVGYYKDLLLRKVAEFENIRKRSESEAASLVKYTKLDVIQSLLPVIDDFERSLKLSKDRRESEAFTKGVELIYQKLMKFLETQGVKEIESLGKEFDVQYHDALLQVPRNDVPPHVVIEVVEKGYSLDDRVLRHAKVVVSTNPTHDGPGNGENQSFRPDSGAAQKLEN